jgi:hypothetical protein
MSCYFTVQVEVARHYRHFNFEGSVDENDNGYSGERSGARPHETFHK